MRLKVKIAKTFKSLERHKRLKETKMHKNVKDLIAK